MKTINIVTPHFLPENSPCTNRILGYINVLNKSYKINVICLTEKGKKSFHVGSEIQNVKIFYIEQRYYNSRNFITRAFNELYYSYKLIFLAKKKSADYIFVTIPYIFLAPLAILFIKAPKILDIRDLVWTYLKEETFISRCIKKVLSTIMHYSILKFNYIIVTNLQERKYILKLNLNIKIILISNGIEKFKFDVLSNLSFKKNKFTVTYIGNIGLAQKIDILLESARELPQINFLIIGNGVAFDGLKNKYKKIKNIEFLGKLEWAELHEYYSITSLLFAQLDYSFESAIPSKLYEYASTGLPILYAGNGAAADFMNQLENTFVIEPNCKEKLMKAIVYVSSQKFLVSSKNKQFINANFIREKNSIELLKILGDLNA